MQWIKVTDQIPQSNSFHIIAFEEGDTEGFEANYIDGKFYYPPDCCNGNKDSEIENVTHWMEFPKAPWKDKE